jgi:bifunctional DNase/RNase
MADSNFVIIKEITLKAEKESGKVIILKEDKESEASLTMFVGEPEFLAIAKEKKLVQTPRPLTHEFYLSILSETGVEFLRVEIYDLKEQTYFAQVIYKINEGERAADARPSDALALALNRNLPVWVRSNLLKKELTVEQVEMYKDLIRSVKF